MSIVAIANKAGSAGKTTTAVTLAVLLAQAGRRVRVIDLDAQANASAWLGQAEPQPPTIHTVLFDRLPLVDAERPVPDVPGLTVVPADPDRMEGAGAELARLLGGERRLLQALNKAETVNDTIIDCPGALDHLTVAALLAADAAVTVAAPTLKEASGVSRFEATVEEVRAGYDTGLRLAAVVPCIVPPANAGMIYTQVMDLLRADYGDLVTPSVRRSARVPEAYAQGVPLPLHAPNEAVTTDYRAVLNHLLAAGLFG